MVSLTKIKHLPKLPNTRKLKIGLLRMDQLSPDEIKFLTFLHFLNPSLESNINRNIIESIYPQEDLRKIIDKFATIGLIEVDEESGRFKIANSWLLDACSQAESILETRDGQEMHYYASQYYLALLKENHSTDLEIELFYHEFMMKDEKKDLLSGIVKFSEKPSKLPSIYSPPIMLERDTGIFKDRQSRICLAKSLINHVSTWKGWLLGGHLLEACRIFDKIIHDSPDENLFEFMSVIDKLYLSTLSDENEGYDDEAFNKYQEIVTLLDSLMAREPEICCYCRCYMKYRLAELYKYKDNQKSIELARDVLAEFGAFTRRYGNKYYEDYESYFIELSNQFKQSKNIGKIWPGIIEMKEWYDARYKESPEIYSENFSRLLNLFCKLLLENLRLETAGVVVPDKSAECYSKALNLHDFQAEWIREDIVLQRKIAKNSDSNLTNLAVSLEIDAEEFKIKHVFKSVLVPTLVKKIVFDVLKIGDYKKDLDRSFLHYEESTEIRWRVADTYLKTAHINRFAYLQKLNEYISTMHSFCWTCRAAGKQERVQKCYRIIVTLSRIIWKFEFFYPNEYYSPVGNNYISYLEESKRYFESIGDTATSALCDKDLASAKHPFAAIFGEMYNNPKKQSELMGEAWNSEGHFHEIEGNMFKQHEIRTGKNIWTLFSYTGQKMKSSPELISIQDYFKDDDINIKPIYQILAPL